MPPSQRILVVNDNKYFTGTWRMLIPEPEFEIVGLAHSTEDAIRMARTLSPDIILADLSHTARRGLKTIETLHTVYPRIPIITFKPVASQEYTQAALNAGATACLTKSEVANVLPQMLSNLSFDPAALAVNPWNYD